MDPRGKVQVTLSPALPATCVCCHAHADGTRKFIDIGLNIDFYGAVVFCTDCMNPVAEACEFVPFSEFKRVADVLELSLDRGKELEAERDKLQHLLDGLLAYRPSAQSDGDSADLLVDAEESDSEGSDDSEPDEVEQRTDESTPESRSEDVRRPTESNGSGLEI